MRILILNDFCSVNGGASKVAIESALGLASAGFLVTYVAMVGPVDVRLKLEPNITVCCANRPTFLDADSRFHAAVMGWWSTEAIAFVSNAILNLPRDSTIVHVHGWVKAFSPSIFSIFRQAGFRVIVTLHDYFLACPNGGFLDYQRVEICKRTALSHSCLTCNCDSRSYPQKLWRFGRGMIQSRGLQLGATVDGFIGVSDFSLSILKPYISSDVAMRVIRNPVGVFENAPRDSEAISGPMIFVGRLSAEKGPHILAEAAKRLGKEILFVGDGNMKDNLAARYPDASFVGWQSKEKVGELMRRSSCLVFPSLWYETNGLVVLEAMAHGIPVVVSKGTAPTEFVKDGFNGRCFEMGDCNDLVRVLSEVLPHQSKVLGRAAYDWYWADPWTLDAHVQDLLKFYAEVMGKPISGRIAI